MYAGWATGGGPGSVALINASLNAACLAAALPGPDAAWAVAAAAVNECWAPAEPGGGGEVVRCEGLAAGPRPGTPCSHTSRGHSAVCITQAQHANAHGVQAVRTEAHARHVALPVMLTSKADRLRAAHCKLVEELTPST